MLLGNFDTVYGNIFEHYGDTCDKTSINLICLVKDMFPKKVNGRYTFNVINQNLWMLVRYAGEVLQPKRAAVRLFWLFPVGSNFCTMCTDNEAPKFSVTVMTRKVSRPTMHFTWLAAFILHNSFSQGSDLSGMNNVLPAAQ